MVDKESFLLNDKTTCLNIVIEVERILGLNWEILSTTLDYKKKNAQTITFQVPVKKNDETVLTYKVRYVN